MELSKAQKARLGTFVATGVILFAGGVISLAGLKIWESRDTYRVRYKDAVGGLEPSAQVKYQGLRVGRVETLRIAEDDPTAIEVEISLEGGTPLYEGTTAVLDMSGITGLKTINLTPGDPRKPKIAPGSMVPAGQSLIDKITGSAEQIALKVELVANQAARWTSDDNRLRIEASLDSLVRLTNNADKLVADIHDPLIAALTEFEKTGASVRAFTSEGTLLMRASKDEIQLTLVAARGAIQQAEKLIKAADAEQVRTTITAARSAMISLDQRLSSAELGQSITNLGIALAKLNQLLGEMDLAVRASREDFVTSLSHVRQATEDLREFSRIIAQDPSVLLRGKEQSE
jgi:phospholipid/cholesterol/gamma-HCH transport system substrate-binding protein